VKAVVEIFRADDERVVVMVDGKEVAFANHDDDGWAGMENCVNTATAVAKALGAEVVGT
jgi:hypothetical protein